MHNNITIVQYKTEQDNQAHCALIVAQKTIGLVRVY